MTMAVKHTRDGQTVKHTRDGGDKWNRVGSHPLQGNTSI
jgi:hypothetical protein